MAWIAGREGWWKKSEFSPEKRTSEFRSLYYDDTGLVRAAAFETLDAAGAVRVDIESSV